MSKKQCDFVYLAFDSWLDCKRCSDRNTCEISQLFIFVLLVLFLDLRWLLLKHWKRCFESIVHHLSRFVAIVFEFNRSNYHNKNKRINKPMHHSTAKWTTISHQYQLAWHQPFEHRHKSMKRSSIFQSIIGQIPLRSPIRLVALQAMSIRLHFFFFQIQPKGKLKNEM